jgi:hypothetical protein
LQRWADHVESLAKPVAPMAEAARRFTTSVVNVKAMALLGVPADYTEDGAKAANAASGR